MKERKNLTKTEIYALILMLCDILTDSKKSGKGSINLDFVNKLTD